MDSLQPQLKPNPSLTAAIMVMAKTNKKLTMLAVVAAVAVGLLLAGVATAASGSGHGRRRVHLRLYMHDVIGGPNRTAIRLIWGVGPPHASMPGRTFGDTVAIDDLVTDGPGLVGDGDDDSRPIGRAQGTYMLSSQHEEVIVVAITVVLTAGPYSGSTLMVAGRDRIHDETRELAVVGGTGALRGASGYVLWTTAKLWSDVHMVLELDVHASVPLPDDQDDDTLGLGSSDQ